MSLLRHSILWQSLLRHLLLRQSLLRLLILWQWPIVFAILALLAIQIQYGTAHLTWKGHGFYPQALVSLIKMYASSSSLLQGKHLRFTPSPLRLNIFRLFVILSLTQLYRYTPEIFLFSTATFKYKYRAPLRRIGQEYSAKVTFSIFQSMKWIQSLPVRSKLI
jgi:hypothetical protein